MRPIATIFGVRKIDDFAKISCTHSQQVNFFYEHREESLKSRRGVNHHGMGVGVAVVLVTAGSSAGLSSVVLHTISVVLSVLHAVAVVPELAGLPRWRPLRPLSCAR